MLGYAEFTTNSSTWTTVEVPLLAVTAYVLTGRRIKISGGAVMQSTVAGDVSTLRLYVDGVQAQAAQVQVVNANQNQSVQVRLVQAPTPGVHTYELRAVRISGTGTWYAAAGVTGPGWLLVEDISGGTGGPGPISLGYAEVTADQAGITTTNVDLTGLAVTINVPAGRTIKITAHVYTHNTSAGAQNVIRINEGATGLMSSALVAGAVSTIEKQIIQRVLTPTAGTHTYKLTADTNLGSMTAAANAARPNWILIEDITGTPSPAGIMPTSQTLAYAEVSANQGGITTETDLTGLTTTVTVPSGRRIKITGRVYAEDTVATDTIALYLKEGSTYINVAQQTGGWNYATDLRVEAIISPSEGTHTYKLTLQRSVGSGTVTMDVAAPGAYPRAFLLVEDITGGAPAVPPVNVPVGVLAQVTNFGNTQTFTSSTLVDITGSSLNIVVPSGRTIRLMAKVHTSGGVGDRVRLAIMEGGTPVGGGYRVMSGGGAGEELVVFAVLSPSAGAHTYKLAMSRDTGAGTATLYSAVSDETTQFIAEDITPTPAPAVGAPSSALGYAEVTANQGTFTAETDLTGLTVTVIVPAGRRLKITGSAYLGSSVGGDQVFTRLQQDGVNIQTAVAFVSTTQSITLERSVILTPSAGTHTYKLRAGRAVGTGNVTSYATPTEPAFLIVEDITGVGFPPYTVAIQPTSQTLALAQTTTSQTGITTEVDVAGLSVTITVPEGRRIRLTMFSTNLGSTVVGDSVAVWIKEGTTALSSQYVGSYKDVTNNGGAGNVTVLAVITPSAGTHTYRVTAARISGTGTVSLLAGAAQPSFLLAEDITGGSPVVAPVSVPVGQLAYAQAIADQAAIGTTLTDLTGLSINIVVPAGRVIRLSAATIFYGFTGAGYAEMQILEGATMVALSQQAAVSGGQESMNCEVVLSPSAGSHTYKVRAHVSTGTMSSGASTQYPAFVMAEDITPTPAPANTAPSSTLGYAEATANQGSIVGSDVDITGLTVTVTVPAGRRLRISGKSYWTSTVTTDEVISFIKEGGAALQEMRLGAIGSAQAHSLEVVVAPSAGTHTYKLAARRLFGSGTLTSNAAAGYPAYILVEDITGSGISGHTHTELDDSGWVPINSFVNGWTYYGGGYTGNVFSSAAWRKKNGIVFLRGLIAGGTTTGGTTMFTLPIGFRPLAGLTHLFAVASGDAFSRIDIEGTGAVKTASAPLSASWVSLSNVSFIAEG